MAQVDLSKTKPTKPTTSKKLSQDFNILATMAMTQIPAIEELINTICNDYIDEDKREKVKLEMNERYINKGHKDCKKMFNKFRKKNSRSKSGYVVFLADPVVVEDLRKKYENTPMKRLNPMKGKLWKTLSKEKRERYTLVGKLMTHKLINVTPDNKRDLIKTWVYKKSVEDIMKLLNTVKETDKPMKKPSKKKSKSEEVKPKIVKKRKKRIIDSELDSDSDSDSDSESETDEIDVTMTEDL